MSRIVLPREEAVAVTHPEVLHGRIRVDHEIVTRLQCGYGDWEGDARLALYCNQQKDRWELWRLEHDAQYRKCGESPRGQRLGEHLYHQIVAHLRGIDTRLGHEPVAALDAHEDALEREQDAELSDWAQNDFADRLAHALRKDGADKHVTGHY